MDDSAGTPDEIWKDYFRERELSPAAVREVVLKLHNADKHEHVIAAIRAALLAGRSQPWMYEVLALSMEIQGHPKEEIERVLLSTVDFTAADVPSMIYSAAYLTRFDRDKQALHLYRQASRLSPARPEPYVMGLKLARRLDDYEAVRWAATGILTYAWTDNYKELHRRAENAALEAREDLRQAGREDEAEAIAQAMQEARRRDLVVEVKWTGNGDVDLLVEEPLGTVCSFENPHSRGGGVLVHDGHGPEQDNCYEKYVCTFGAGGVYRIRVRHVWGKVVGKRVRLKITRHLGTSREASRTFVVPLGKGDKIVRLNLRDGRREKPANVPGQKLLIGGEQSRLDGAFRRNVRLGAGARESARRFRESRRRTAGRRAGAVGFAPVISLIPEGISLRAGAVVSGDRRYVRLSLTPVFNNVTDVFTFSFINGGGTAAGGNAGGAAGNR